MSVNEALNAVRGRPVEVAVVAGLVSGALSAFLFSIGTQQYSWVAPGVAFGVIFGAVLFLMRLARLWQAALFAAASELCWYAAYRFALSLFEWIGNSLQDAEGRMVIVGLAAGVLGAALLAGGTAALFPWFRSWRRILATAAVGGATGMLTGLEWGEGYPLFIVWQGAFALCLALAFPPRTEKSAA